MLSCCPDDQLVSSAAPDTSLSSGRIWEKRCEMTCIIICLKICHISLNIVFTHLEVVSTLPVWKNDILPITQASDVTLWPSKKQFKCQGTLEGTLNLKELCWVPGSQPGMIRTHHQAFLLYSMPLNLQEFDEFVLIFLPWRWGVHSGIFVGK